MGLVILSVFALAYAACGGTDNTTPNTDETGSTATGTTGETGNTGDIEESQPVRVLRIDIIGDRDVLTKIAETQLGVGAAVRATSPTNVTMLNNFASMMSYEGQKPNIGSNLRMMVYWEDRTAGEVVTFSEAAGFRTDPAILNLADLRRENKYGGAGTINATSAAPANLPDGTAPNREVSIRIYHKDSPGISAALDLPGVFALSYDASRIGAGPDDYNEYGLKVGDGTYDELLFEDEINYWPVMDSFPTITGLYEAYYVTTNECVTEGVAPVGVIPAHSKTFQPNDYNIFWEYGPGWAQETGDPVYTAASPRYKGGIDVEKARAYVLISKGTASGYATTNSLRAGAESHRIVYAPFEDDNIYLVRRMDIVPNNLRDKLNHKYYEDQRFSGSAFETSLRADLLASNLQLQVKYYGTEEEKTRPVSYLAHAFSSEINRARIAVPGNEQLRDAEKKPEEVRLAVAYYNYKDTDDDVRAFNISTGINIPVGILSSLKAERIERTGQGQAEVDPPQVYARLKGLDDDKPISPGEIARIVEAYDFIAVYDFPDGSQYDRNLNTTTIYGGTDTLFTWLQKVAAPVTDPYPLSWFGKEGIIKDFVNGRGDDEKTVTLTLKVPAITDVTAAKPTGATDNQYYKFNKKTIELDVRVPPYITWSPWLP